jgi:hypothetical protein
MRYMDTEATIQIYNVQPIMMPIVPASASTLQETFNVNVNYSATTGQLGVTMSFMIPGNLNPSQVSIKQYYSSNEPSTLEFYAVYSSESTATPKQVDCKFKASTVDANNTPISLGSILSVMTMMVCTSGPKTSRGVVNAVRLTGE